MSENALERLRQLNAYRLEGSLSFEAYREERRALLDDFEARAANYAETVRPNRAAIDEAERAARIRERRSRLGLFVAAAAVLLIGVPLAFIVLQSVGPDITEEAIRQTPNMNRPLKLVSRFLGRNDWGKASTERFLAAWHELDEAERRMIRDGRVFKSFTDSLRAQARKERAEAGANAVPVLPLEAFAAELGVAIPVTPARAGLDDAAVEPDNRRQERPGPPGQAAIEPATQTLVGSPTPIEAGSDAPADLPSATGVAPPAVVATRDSTAPATSAATGLIEPPQPCSGMTLSADQRRCAEELTDGVYGPQMVVVEPSTGAPFLMSQWEVTYREFNVFCRWEDRECPRSVWGDDEAPVVLVSWSDAVAYAGWLSWLTGAEYRVPTEDEWEQATAYVEGMAPELLEEAGRLRTPSSRDTELDSDGIMHLAGNVQEWVARAGEYAVSLATDNRTVRGGCYADDRESLSPAIERSVDGVTADRCTGFRVVRALPTEVSANRH